MRPRHHHGLWLLLPLALLMHCYVDPAPIRAKEAVLDANLHTLRAVIAEYRNANGYHPRSLDVLVTDGYLRQLPTDPMTGRAYAPSLEETTGAIVDVHSTSTRTGTNGIPYDRW
jgi:general secretion pathway protein G